MVLSSLVVDFVEGLDGVDYVWFNGLLVYHWLNDFVHVVVAVDVLEH